jgi:OCT family organic cation transporter-like MFS transporter 4/5
MQWLWQYAWGMYRSRALQVLLWVARTHCAVTNLSAGALIPLPLSLSLLSLLPLLLSLLSLHNRMVVCMAYYGISFALSGLGGSLLVSFSIASIAELPSYIIAGWMIEKWGRHNIMAGGMLLGGAACLGCGLIPSGPGQAGLAAVGKFGIAGSFAIASIYTSELFPTLIRSAVLGAENQAARVGGIVAPFIALAGVTTGNSMVSFGTFGCAALLAGILVFTLPETLGAPLPETMSDMGVIASIFTHKTLQKKGLKAATLSMFKTKVKVPKAAAALQATEEEEELEAAEEERAATLGRRPGN